MNKNRKKDIVLIHVETELETETETERKTISSHKL